MEVFNPSGATGVTAPFAPRLRTLNGKKIGLLSNGHWQAHRTLPLLQRVLQDEYAMSTFVLIHADEAIEHDKTVDAIAAEKYDAVIVGNAA